MFEQTFKNIDNILRNESKASTELDYISQISWVLFLRYLVALEERRAEEATLTGKTYTPILDEPYRWEVWAVPKKLKAGTENEYVIDHEAMIGDDLIAFVRDELFPYLANFRNTAPNFDSIEYKIGEIFSETELKIGSGYNLRDILERIDELQINSTKDKHQLSDLYETRIKNMGNAGRNGGEYYTPRPLIRAMIQVTDPQIGETVYDGAAGSAGFLCEAYEYMYKSKKLTTSDLDTLQNHTFFGVEKKNLAYVIGLMNMILHGIETPNLIRKNTLAENIMDIQVKDRHDVILANPPFGSKERDEIKNPFPIVMSETAFLFLQHFIKKLKAGGRAAIIIKNTFLSNTDHACVALRKHLLESCNLHTIIDMPGGTFLSTGVKTIVLFFKKGESTKKIWYYQLDPGRKMGKTNPLNDKDLAEFVQLQKTKPETEKSWNFNIADMDETTADLSVKNPNTPEEAPLRSPQEILTEMEKLDIENQQLLQTVKTLI